MKASGGAVGKRSKGGGVAGDIGGGDLEEGRVANAVLMLDPYL